MELWRGEKGEERKAGKGGEGSWGGGLSSEGREGEREGEGREEEG